MENYYVIFNFDDKISIEKMSQKELLKRLNEGGWYGLEPVYFPEFSEKNTAYLDIDDVLIIRGDIVTPKPVHTVVKYTI